MHNTLINHGTIRATGLNAGGMEAVVGSDCLVINYGRIESGTVGMIAGAFHGTDFHNTIVNYGEIHLRGEPTGLGFGIAVIAWGAGSIVRNYGTILLDGDFSFGVDGLDVADAGSLVENYGQIYATAYRALALCTFMGDNLPPISLGWGGDGDEIDAIGEVEREFGVRLNYANAAQWMTVGDVFEALLESIPSELTESRDTWPRFARAISEETGVDPSKVTSDTLLLGKAMFDWRVALIVGCFVVIALATARYR